jgi:hypothetical protein
MLSMVPSAGAFKIFSIFMASNTSSGSPFCLAGLHPNVDDEARHGSLQLVDLRSGRASKSHPVKKLVKPVFGLQLDALTIDF